MSLPVKVDVLYVIFNLSDDVRLPSESHSDSGVGRALDGCVVGRALCTYAWYSPALHSGRLRHVARRGLEDRLLPAVRIAYRLAHVGQRLVAWMARARPVIGRLSAVEALRGRHCYSL